MIYVFIWGFFLGLVVSDTLVTKMARVFIRSKSEPVREATRKFARSRDIDLQEKGRIVKTASYDAMDAFDEVDNVLDALDKVPHADS